MAQLKDTLVTGDLRVTDNTITDSLQVTTVNAKTGSSATTYGPGTDGQVLKSNGTSTYWASDNNSDTKVTQTATTTDANYEVLFSETADNTTRTEGARKDSELTFNPSTDTLTTTNLKLTKVQNQILTGTGTAAKDAGETADPRYFPAKWTYNANITPADGDIIVIKIPVAGHTYGVFISVNNGTTYYPISSNGTSRLTTHYENGQIISLVFASNGQTNDVFPLNGGNSRVNVTGGCWRVTNFYDSGNTNTKVTQTATTTDANYEVLFSVTDDNTTRTEGARKNSNLKFNPSTGNLQTTQINGVTVGSNPKFTDENTTYTFAEGSVNGKFSVTPSGGSAQSVPIHGLSNLAYKSKVDTSYMEPLYTNTYTGLIGSDNTVADASFYFGKIIPTSYTGIWKIHYRIYAEAAGRTDSKSWHDCWVEGNRSSVPTYASYNTIADTTYNPLRYTLVYKATEAGITGNYGHLLGVGLRDSWARTTAANSRTIKVEIIETIDCTYTPWNTAVKYANVPGTGSTNYSGIAEIDAYNNGLREVGDDNTTVHNRINYFAGKTGTIGVYASTLFMEDSNGTYQSIVTSSTTGTKTANSNGFRVGSSIWYSTTTYAANTNINGQTVVYSAVSPADSRYAFNVGLTANALTTYKPIYLVGTINDTTRLFYLDATWWTQTPNDSSKVYILVGGVYVSSTSSQSYALYEQNPWYRYDGSKLVEMDKAYLAANGFKMYGNLDMNYNTISNARFTIINIDGHFMSGLKASTDPEADPPSYDYLIYDEYGTWSLLYDLEEYTVPFNGGEPIAHLAYGRPSQSQLNQVLTLSNVRGGIKASGYTIAKSVPSDAVFTDTKNTAGSTDTSNQIFLIGATSQAANPQTYSDNEVYVTNGVLTTKSVQVGGTAATIQYNSNTQSIDFVFSS